MNTCQRHIRHRNRRQPYRTRSRLATPILLGVLLAVQVGRAATPESDNEPVVVQVQAGPSGRPSILVDESLRLSPSQLAQSREELRLHGVSFQREAGSDFVAIATGTRQMVINVEGFPGWVATLAPETRAALHPASSNGTLQLRTFKGNAHPVRVRFADGASAVMHGAAHLDFEQYSDHSYLLRGRGEITATSAEGNPRPLRAGLLPLAGGPLELVPHPDGTTHLERRLPTLPVIITGAAGEELEVRVGSQTFNIAASGRATIVCSNGAALRLEWNRATGRLGWQVERGDFRFRVPGVAGWQLVGMTGQSGNLLWDSVNGAVDIENRSSADPLVVVLPRQRLVNIASGATFQLKRLSDTVFSTAAARGEVTLHDPDTGQVTALGHGPFQVNDYPPSPRPAIGSAETAVTLHRPQPDLLEVRTLFGGDRVRPGEEALLTTPDGNQLQVELLATGDTVLLAIHGDYRIYLHPRSPVAVEVPAGNGLILAAQPCDAMTAQALPANSGPIRMRVSGRLMPWLYPNESITLLGATLFALAPQPPYAVFMGDLIDPGQTSPRVEQAAPLAGSPEEWSFGRYVEELYDPRIVQPPATVIR